jgi:hypothetical protein
MTNDEIIHYYDTHLNLTLKELSQMTGKSVADLKKLLLSDWTKNAKKIVKQLSLKETT